jgi:hypothetical protein
MLIIFITKKKNEVAFRRRESTCCSFIAAVLFSGLNEISRHGGVVEMK